MSDIFITYPGGKNGSGTYQKLINLMPPHRMYVEAFLGGGAILRAKRPAVENVGIELNKSVVDDWRLVEFRREIPNLRVHWADGVSWLGDHANILGPDCLVYADPPYLMSTRSAQRQLYTIEMAEEKQHRDLIDVLRSLECMVMLSGYWSQLYADLLPDWRTYSFQSMTRGGTMATEWVWMNYPQPLALHDYRYLGDTFRQREQLKRMKERWQARLGAMPTLKRQALLMAIQEFEPAGNGIPADSTRCNDDAGACSSGAVGVITSPDPAMTADSGAFDDITSPGDECRLPTAVEVEMGSNKVESCSCVDFNAVACWAFRYDIPTSDVTDDGGPCMCPCHDGCDDDE